MDPYRTHWYYRHFYRNGSYDFPLAFAWTVGLMYGGLFLLIAIGTIFDL
jgi:hypothetical protein